MQQSMIGRDSKMDPTMMDQSVTGPRAWRRDDISQSDWLVEFSPEALQELYRVVEALRQTPHSIPSLMPGMFELKNCREDIRKVKYILDEGVGFVVLDRLPVSELAADESKALCWILSSLIARPVEQNVHGTMLYDVKDTGKTHGNGVRGDSTNVNLNFHTDNCYNDALPDYLSLLCLNKGQEGGLSKSISFYTVHNELLQHSPDILRRLYQRFWFDRQREHQPGDAMVHHFPIFSYDAAQGLRTRFTIHLIRWGYELAKEPIDNETEEVLEAFLKVLERADLQVEFLLEPGQIEFTRNATCGHSRTRFVDPPEIHLRRHMVRYWLRDGGLTSYSGR